MKNHAFITDCFTTRHVGVKLNIKYQYPFLFSFKLKIIIPAEVKYE